MQEVEAEHKARRITAINEGPAGQVDVQATGEAEAAEVPLIEA